MSSNVVGIPWCDGTVKKVPEYTRIAVSYYGRIVLGVARLNGWSETSNSEAIPWGDSKAEHALPHTRMVV